MLVQHAILAWRSIRRGGLYAVLMILGLAISLAAAMIITLYVREELTHDRFVPGHQTVFRISQTV
jgi:putative ABC transport system permease protein